MVNSGSEILVNHNTKIFINSGRINFGKQLTEILVNNGRKIFVNSGKIKFGKQLREILVNCGRTTLLNSVRKILAERGWEN